MNGWKWYLEWMIESGLKGEWLKVVSKVYDWK